MLPTILITAKQNSERFPQKNMKIIGGISLAERALISAQDIPSKEIIVCTDIPDLKHIVMSKYGKYTIKDHPVNKTHEEIIHHSITDKNCPVILLQPTSPFRYNNIIEQCWNKYLNYPDSTILTTSHNHNAVIENNQLINYKSSINLWDGCVVIYPPNKLCNYKNVQSIRNFYLNSIQIDTPEDYVFACSAYETYKPIDTILSKSMYNIIKSIFMNNNICNIVTLVTRKTDIPIPQEYPVIYVNHCLGYDGRRCDAIFLIANKHLRMVGISDSLQECIKKTKCVIVRHNGELDWLIKTVPELQNKIYIIRDAISKTDDHLSTGCLAIEILYNIGIKNINCIGLYSINNIQTMLMPYHYLTISREIALINQAGLI